MVKLAASAAFETAPPDRSSLSISRLFPSPNVSPVPKLLNKSIFTVTNTHKYDSLIYFVLAEVYET